MEAHFEPIQAYDLDYALEQRINQSEQVNNSWKKAVSEKIVNRILKSRESRIGSIRLKKAEILNEVKGELVKDCFGNLIMTDNNFEATAEDTILSEYINKVVDLFENEDFRPQFEFEMHSTDFLSTCPICFSPVIWSGKAVICTNLCFEYKIPNWVINKDFTLDNFLDVFNRIRLEHISCNDTIEIIEFDGTFEFVCSKCVLNVIN
jgi:hypothetical protein